MRIRFRSFCTLQCKDVLSSQRDIGYLWRDAKANGCDCSPNWGEISGIDGARCWQRLASFTYGIVRDSEGICELQIGTVCACLKSFKNLIDFVANPCKMIWCMPLHPAGRNSKLCSTVISAFWSDLFARRIAQTRSKQCPKSFEHMPESITKLKVQLTLWNICDVPCFGGAPNASSTRVAAPSCISRHHRHNLALCLAKSAKCKYLDDLRIDCQYGWKAFALTSGNMCCKNICKPQSNATSARSSGDDRCGALRFCKMINVFLFRGHVMRN